MLSSLGFVFAALIEFAVIIVLHHKTRKPKAKCAQKKKLILKKIYESRSRHQKVAAFKNEKNKMTGTNEADHDEKNLSNPEEDRKLARKIDIISFIAYVIGYLLFNLFYWIDMLSN